MLNVIEVGRRIAEARTDMGISKKELAERVKVSAATITRYEKGQFTDPKIPVLDAIANTLGVNPLWICLRSDEKHATPPRRKGVKIPVLGTVAAGVPIEAIENIIDYEEIPESLARKGQFFGLVISGQSMEPTIQEGDVIICKWEQTCDTGDIAVVMVNGDEATVKEIKRGFDGVTLIGHNVAVFPPKFYSNYEIETLPVRVIGVVYEVRRKFKAYREE